jgi:hypothetical protein
MTRGLVAFGVALVASIPSHARAYDEEVHAFLVRTALEKSALDTPAGPLDPKAAERIRSTIDGWARNASDEKLKLAWTRRYPTPSSFDAWAEKELLLFSPAANVFGIDRMPADVSTMLAAVEIGAREPDDDWRNRERLGYDANRKALRDKEGADVPADPAILNMGKLGALSSQAHAHYGLAHVTFSDDPDVLKKDPRRFAVASGYPPGPILTIAAEMAETHLELAMIAALDDEAPNPTLAWLHTGQAFHYLQDVCNQIHTVQVGIYDFFVDATIERVKMAIRTGGGYLGTLRSLASIGIDILTNHHVISEQFTKKRVMEALAGHGSPEGERLVAAPKGDDPDLLQRLETVTATAGEGFGIVLVRELIDVSSREGADVYRATRAITDPRFRKAGILYDEAHDDPDQAILPRNERDEEAYGELLALEGRGFRRAGTAMRRWIALEKKAFESTGEEKNHLRDRAIERLVRRQLLILEQAETRRSDYIAHPPAHGSGVDRMPIMLVIEVAIALIALALIARRTSRRRRKRAT